MKTYRNALILGAGLSGLGAARLLAAAGTAVTVADQREPHLLAAVAEQLESWGARPHFGQATLPWEAFELGVISPGFAFKSDWVQAAYALCAEIFSELELGWQAAARPTIAVTGSNGKSTVVKWLAEALTHAGKRAVVAGNYGRSVCEVAATEDAIDWLVLEVSSFQLETVHAFRPDVGLLLNLLPNHLDRHGTFAAYAHIKARLFARMQTTDQAWIPVDTDPDLRAHMANAAAPVWHAFGDTAAAEYMAAAGRVYAGTAEKVDLRGTHFGSPGMARAAAAVTGILDQLGIDPIHAQASARAFQALPHRVQVVARAGDVTYINDSKSTNLAAISHAVQSLTEPVHLIAGGLAKEPDFKKIKEVLTERVRSVYLIGNAAEQMFSAWSPDISCVMCGTLEEAVRQARKRVCAGESVLFSPGCASFDQYRNYEERGEHYTRLVRELVEKERA
jgi:UDP-N-acetylmuramoylalanine--D-glutamate ligase